MALGDKLPISFSLYSFSLKIIVLRHKQLPDGVNLRAAHLPHALLWKQKLKLNTAAFHSHLWEHLDIIGLSLTFRNIIFWEDRFTNVSWRESALQSFPCYKIFQDRVRNICKLWCHFSWWLCWKFYGIVDLVTGLCNSEMVVIFLGEQGMEYIAQKQGRNLCEFYVLRADEMADNIAT